MSRAEVYGVVTFYHDYRKPSGRPPCAEALPGRSLPVDGLATRIAAQLKQRLGIGFHETAKDGAVTLEPVYCLGLCACAPSAMLDGEVIGRLDDGQDRARSSRRCGHDAYDLRSRRFRRAGARRRKGRRADRARGRRRAASTRQDRAQRLARRSTGWSRWSRWRRRKAAWPTARWRPTDVAVLFEAGFLDGQAHPLALGRAGGNPVPGGRRA